ncbi:hypothetical protein JZO77_09815 [Enterococcus hulanensis]|uniref:hypothetical protein n=1 Tax=Enterococcus hulanensis TaxID=2559929 RepID=UPI001A8E0C10|nr:hypothetical protein [Enterococcus hulanensis]MBO0457029.1 hypothetical protein [Enterococcus hulanensis]
MKKVRVVIVIALALVLFAGCKKQTQKDFTAELAKQNEMNAGKYSLVIDKMTYSNDDADARTRASMDMASKMVSGTKISGDYLKDTKKKLVAMDMTVAVLGQQIPVELVSNQKDHSIYVNANLATEINEILKVFSSDISIEAKDLEQLKGKYIHATEADLKKIISSKTDTAVTGNKVNSKLFSEYIDTLEPDSFEKKEDTIKRTFTKKDIQGFIKYAKENGNKDEKKSVKALEKNFDQLTKYEQTITLNTKKHTQKTTMTVAAKKDDTTVSVDLTMDNEAKESDKKVQLPKKANTVSMEKLEEIVGSAQKEESLISEEDFNDLLEVIRRGGGQFSQTEIDQIKRTYKPYLTDEQYKQLEEALDQAGQITA